MAIRRSPWLAGAVRKVEMACVSPLDGGIHDHMHNKMHGKGFCPREQHAHLCSLPNLQKYAKVIAKGF